MPKTSKLEKIAIRMFVLQEELKELEREKLATIQGIAIRCVHCRKNSKLHSWTFLMRFERLSPKERAQGYTKVPKPWEACSISCPVCGRANNISAHPQTEMITTLIINNPFGLDRLFTKVKEMPPYC